ncbi:RNA polymerase sigma factor [Pseudonocardia lacus]|uniref:RNA polymerase sigma factor n=1 Tax=Pseudonocardia lacus TaxID=2835865 RepID=UPI001BDDAB55|nr:sigma-70 family RNA polymerase sigma factor [Pseudonocardia lacus]
MHMLLDARAAGGMGARSDRGRCSGPARGSTLSDMRSPDQLLAARLAAGDERALTEAFDALASAVHTAAVRVLGQTATAQDVVQDVFVELWRRPQRYDPALGSLRTYLIVSARHRAYDVLRSELRRMGREARHHRLTPGHHQDSPDEKVADALTASTVREALRTLPAEQRQVVEMAYFGGLSYREVARTVGISEGTAKSRIRLALGKLEILLDRQMLESS